MHFVSFISHYRATITVTLHFCLRYIPLFVKLRNSLYFIGSNYRLEKVLQLRWETGPTVPESVRANIGIHENEAFRQYQNLLNDYNSSIGLDLTAVSNRETAPIE